MRGMNNAGTEARQPEETEARQLEGTEARQLEEEPLGKSVVKGLGRPLGKSVKGWRPMLRHPDIDYSRGWFFVTIQAAFNKTIFGAIVGERAVLNDLGAAIEETIRNLGTYYPGTTIDTFVVMPNHVHLLVKIDGRPTNSPHQLGVVIGRFKSYCSKLYRDLKSAGRVVDVGTTPWQRDYWESLAADETVREKVRAYIRNNPKKWTRDRFGLVTSHVYGNVGLLNAAFVGFVASQGAYQDDLKPRLLWKRPQTGRRHLDADDETPVEAEAEKPPVISTFTSAQERAVFDRVLRNGQRFIRVYPGGIPPEAELPEEIRKSCAEGRALLISPVETGSGLNKQRAVWCNEYILRNAAEVWAGAVTPGHTLASLVAALAPTPPTSSWRTSASA